MEESSLKHAMLLQISSGCRYSVHTRAVPITVTDGAVGQKPSSYSEKMADCKGKENSFLGFTSFMSFLQCPWASLHCRFLGHRVFMVEIVIVSLRLKVRFWLFGKFVCVLLSSVWR